MSERRTHHVTTSDGVILGGTVRGHGPAGGAVHLPPAQHAGDLGYFETAGRYVPHLLLVLQQAMASADPTSDPAVLGAIRAPTVVLVGSATKPVFAASAAYVVDHVPHARPRQVPGTGHAAPLTHPQALAAALGEFFTSTPQPA